VRQRGKIGLDIYVKAHIIVFTYPTKIVTEQNNFSFSLAQQAEAGVIFDGFVCASPSCVLLSFYLNDRFISPNG
jgi:hypothetical protein